MNIIYLFSVLKWVITKYQLTCIDLYTKQFENIKERTLWTFNGYQRSPFLLYSQLFTDYLSLKLTLLTDKMFERFTK